MKSNAAKSKQSTASKSASSSTRSRRSTSVSKSNLSRHNQPNADGLDEIVDRVEVCTVESEAGDRVLAKTGIDSGVSGTVVLESELTNETGFAFGKEKPAAKLAAAKPGISQSPSAMMFSENMQAITLHQPWASLIAAGKKQYETRSWSTNYRGPIAIHAGKKLHEDENLISLVEFPKFPMVLGAIVAIAELTDCILMDEKFILKQSSFEQFLGLWEVGRYAWKLENVRAIEPIAASGKQGLWIWAYSKDAIDAFGNKKAPQPDDADCGEVQHLAEPSGQLNLLEWNSNEPPEPDDFPGDL